MRRPAVETRNQITITSAPLHNNMSSTTPSMAAKTGCPPPRQHTVEFNDPLGRHTGSMGLPNYTEESVTSHKHGSCATLTSLILHARVRNLCNTCHDVRAGCAVGIVYPLSHRVAGQLRRDSREHVIQSGGVFQPAPGNKSGPRERLLLPLGGSSGPLRGYTSEAGLLVYVRVYVLFVHAWFPSAGEEGGQVLRPACSAGEPRPIAPHTARSSPPRPLEPPAVFIILSQRHPPSQGEELFSAPS